VGKNVIIRRKKKIEKPGKFSTTLQKNDMLRVETPGGGGYGGGSDHKKSEKRKALSGNDGRDLGVQSK
jgi:N-methylhydantoinase B/oxoprolinase/acetone carboxylase alpha subunit